MAISFLPQDSFSSYYYAVLVESLLVLAPICESDESVKRLKFKCHLLLDFLLLLEVPSATFSICLPSASSYSEAAAAAPVAAGVAAAAAAAAETAAAAAASSN